MGGRLLGLFSWEGGCWACSHGREAARLVLMGGRLLGLFSWEGGC